MTLTAPSTLPERVLEHLGTQRPRLLEWLKDFLRIPSVSADPAFAPHMDAARSLLLTRLQQIGLHKVRLLDGGGEPAVYGEWIGAPGKPTLLVYGHYDVQPADPVERWHTPPFDPVEIDGRLYGRGTSDVKASTTIALETVAAYLAVEGACPVNIKVFLEGEEETGSPSMRTIVARHSALLQADAVLSADGGRASPTLPTINVGARGNAQLEVRLQTADKDLHSGRYGGGGGHALHEMTRLIASLHDEEGKVAVEGFHAGAETLSTAQRADTAAFVYDEQDFFASVGAAPHGEAGYSTRERITLRPALDVNGLWGGYAGPGGKTIVPCEAFAKMTARVVAGQDPGAVMRAVLDHLQRRCPSGCKLEVVAFHEGSPASTLRPSHPLVQAATSVLERECGRKPIHVRLGASVPVTALFKEMLGLDTLMFGFNLPDEDVHAPNEFFRLSSIDEGLRGWTLLLAALAEQAPERFHAEVSRQASTGL